MAQTMGNPSDHAAKVGGGLTWPMPVSGRIQTPAVGIVNGGIMTERGALRALRAQLGAAGTATLTARVLINGTAAAGTVSLASGVTSAILSYAEIAVEVGDRIEVDVATAPAGVGTGLVLTADIVRRFGA